MISEGGLFDAVDAPSKSLLAPLHPYFEVFCATLVDVLIGLLVLGFVVFLGLAVCGLVSSFFEAGND